MGKKKKKNWTINNISKGHGVQIHNTKGNVKIDQSSNTHNKGIQQNSINIEQVFLGSDYGESVMAKSSSDNPPASASQSASIATPTVIMVILAIILVIAATTIFVYTKSTQTMEDAYNMESENMQKFSATSQNIERAGFPYTEYILTSEPSNGGFHVRPYPYILYTESGGDKILPILNLFTQEEYTADTFGQCTLLQESLSLPFTDPNNSDCSFTLEHVHCFVAILYTKDAKSIRAMYELRDGELTYADKETAIRVLQIFEDIDNSTTIDIRNLPLGITK